MPAPASLPHFLPQIDFLALYKEGHASFFSLQELKGTEGQARGEITFNKPTDLKDGDPRLPALPGDYIVKYHEGNTKNVKQEKKFAVQKCEPSSPAEGGSKVRAVDHSKVNGSVNAGDDSKTSDKKDAVEKPKEGGQAEASSVVSKKEGSKPESDGKVGEKDAKAKPKAGKTDETSEAPPKDVVAKKDVAKTDESNAATSSAPVAGATMQAKDGENADQLSASNQRKQTGANAVPAQKVAATKASVVSAATQVAEGQTLAASPSQQGATAASEKEPVKEEKKTEEKKTSAASLLGGVADAAASLLGGVKTKMKSAEEKKLKEGGQAEASSVVDKKDGNKSESDGKGSEKEGEDGSKVVSGQEKKEGQSPGAGAKQVVKDFKDAPKTGGAENQQEAAGKPEGAVNQPAEETMPGKKVDEATKKGADGGKDGAVKPDGNGKTGDSKGAVEKPKEGGQAEASSAQGKKEGSKPESDGKVGEKDAKAKPKAGKTDDTSEAPPKDVVAKEVSKAELDKETSSSSSAMEKARKEALNKDWSQLEQDKVSAPTPASNPNSPEGKGPPGGQGRNGPGQVIDDEDNADEGGEWGGGSASVGKIAQMTRAQEEWLNGPRSKGALAGREEKGSAPSAPQGREPQGEKGKEKGAPEGAPRPAEAQEKEDKEVRPQAVGSGDKHASGEGDGSGEKEGKEGKSKQDSTTKAKDSKTALKAADAVGGDAHKKHAANKESTSKMQKAETEGSGKGAGKAAGGFAGLLAMAGMRLCFPFFICMGLLAMAASFTYNYTKLHHTIMLRKVLPYPVAAMRHKLN